MRWLIRRPAKSSSQAAPGSPRLLDSAGAGEDHASPMRRVKQKLKPSEQVARMIAALGPPLRDAPSLPAHLPPFDCLTLLLCNSSHEPSASTSSAPVALPKY